MVQQSSTEPPGADACNASLALPGPKECDAVAAEALLVVVLHPAVRRDSGTIRADSPHMVPSAMSADQSVGKRLKMP